MVMPGIDNNFIENCKKKYPNLKFNVFVETGTYQGNTILKLEPFFDKLYTIEIKKDLYNETKKKYCGNKIEFILGDSAEKLRKIAATLNENCIFFLDGHWSRGITGKGKKDVPIIEELNSINNYFKHAAIIIIDDRRLFEKGPNLAKKHYPVDWSNIKEETIIKIMSKRLVNFYYKNSFCAKNDRLILNINPI